MENKVNIKTLIEKADKKLDYGDYKKAQALYEKALNLLPEPKREQEEYIELMGAIGDTLLFQGKNSVALKLYNDLMKLPETQDNAFLHLRRGQVYCGMDKLELAEKDLKRALALGGEKIFEDEQEEYYQVAIGTYKAE